MRIQIISESPVEEKAIEKLITERNKLFNLELNLADVIIERQSFSSSFTRPREMTIELSSRPIY